MVIHWSLSDSKSLQVSRTLLSILSNLNNYFTHLRVSHTSISWWSFTGVWVTASLFKSPGLFLVLCPYSFESLSHQHKLIVFHWSLSDSKSPQVSGPLLSILANLNNAGVGMVSTSLISNSASPFTNLSEIVPSALITIGITVTFIFHISPNPNFWNNI